VSRSRPTRPSTRPVEHRLIANPYLNHEQSGGQTTAKATPVRQKRTSCNWPASRPPCGGVLWPPPKKTTKKKKKSPKKKRKTTRHRRLLLPRANPSKEKRRGPGSQETEKPEPRSTSSKGRVPVTRTAINVSCSPADPREAWCCGAGLKAAVGPGARPRAESAAAPPCRRLLCGESPLMPASEPIRRGWLPAGSG